MLSIFLVFACRIEIGTPLTLQSKWPWKGNQWLLLNAATMKPHDGWIKQFHQSEIRLSKYVCRLHFVMWTNKSSHIRSTRKLKKTMISNKNPIPVGSMYGIFTYICHTWILWDGNLLFHGRFLTLPIFRLPFERRLRGWSSTLTSKMGLVSLVEFLEDRWSIYRGH